MDWTLIPVLLAIGAVIGFLAGLLGAVRWDVGDDERMAR
jgi:hypothetical protein